MEILISFQIRLRDRRRRSVEPPGGVHVLQGDVIGFTVRGKNPLPFAVTDATPNVIRMNEQTPGQTVEVAGRLFPIQAVTSKLSLLPPQLDRS